MFAEEILCIFIYCICLYFEDILKSNLAYNKNVQKLLFAHF